MEWETEDSAEPELEAVIRGACPAADDLASRVVRSRVLAGLFDKPEHVQIGRYRLEQMAGEGGGGIVFAAWDPELSRRVAIKLIEAEGRRDRVVAEAHALARLAHPNVVAIYDVGTHGNQIFLVMELVDGATLRAWCDAGVRSVRDIVRVYREAGEGLAAAHRAGFVHRDFKPDNALIGSDGRVRVVDFGLAHAGGAASAPGVGTPRYMAPEQLAGGAITPAVDQYAFCASLREAITSRRDTSGARVQSLPRWIEAITARGLSREPADRYPSFDALLRELANDPATRWKRRALVAGVAAIGATAFVVGRAQTADGITCPDARAELAPAWSTAIRTTIADHLASLPTAYAQQARTHVLASLDAYGDRWVTVHGSACAARKRGAESDVLFDRKIACLDRARAALTSAVGVLRGATGDQLAQALTSVGELPALDRCSDPAALDDRIEPVPIAAAAAVAQLDRELAALAVQVRAGQANRPEVRDAAAQLVARARALGYRPLLARALRVLGVGALALTDRAAAVEPLREATTLAFASGADELAVEAFARRAWSEGTLRDPVGALAGLPIVEAIASRLPEIARPTRALLANNVGSVELAAGHRGAARSRFEQAMREIAASPGEPSIELSLVPANLALVIDDPRRRAMLFSETIEQLTAKLGADHPLTLDVRVKAALNTDDDRAAERELGAVCTAYRDLHPEQRTMIAECAFDLGELALDRDDRASARTWFAVAAAIEARELEKERVVLARAHVARLDGDPRAAIAMFNETRAKLARGNDLPWWDRVQVAQADFGIGLSARDTGDHAAAKTALQRAATTFEQVLAIKPGASRVRSLQRAKRALDGL